MHPSIPALLLPLLLAASISAAGPVEDTAAKLSDPSPEVRAKAASDLSFYGEGAKPAAPALAGAVKDPDKMVRRHAIMALGLSGADDPAAIKALTGAMLDSDEMNAKSARHALTGIAAKSPAAAGTLVELLKDPDSNIPWLSASVLMNARAQASRHLPAISALAAEGSPAPARSQALRLLGAAGKNNPEARATLFQAMKSTDTAVVMGAAEGIGHMGPPGAPAIPALRQMLGSDNPLLSFTAVKALGRIGPKAAEAGPELLALTGSDNRDMRDLAVEAIGKIGYADGLEEIERLTSDPDGRIAGTAATAAAKIKAARRAAGGEPAGTKTMGRSKKPKPAPGAAPEPSQSAAGESGAPPR